MAAECALSAGQPDRAVELLEHGRGVLWSQTLDTRTDITALRERAGRTVLDKVISSYTPTPRSLVSARSAGDYPVDNRMLVVALPETPGQPPLPKTARERDRLTALFEAPHSDSGAYGDS